MSGLSLVDMKIQTQQYRDRLPPFVIKAEHSVTLLSVVSYLLLTLGLSFFS